MQRATRSDSAERLQDFLPVLAAGNDGQRSQIGSVGAPYAALPHGIPRRVGYRVRAQFARRVTGYL
jgi:hypothetical protein